MREDAIGLRAGALTAVPGGRFARRPTMADLQTILNDAVRKHRRLSGDERLGLRVLVSERVRELRPYTTHGEDAVPGGRARRRGGEQTAPSGEGLPLSKREYEVLVAMMLGKDNSEIAGRALCDPQTVQSHFKHVVAKLGAANRVHAAVLVLAHALVSKEDRVNAS
jgi:DNA-binding CsgD family transcriptional regulator